MENPNVKILILLLLFADLSFAHLLKDESMIKVNGYPALSYFKQGQRDKPLIVFLPGMSHLGRVAYGTPGTHKKDFLAYWLQKKGYSFLAISYPLDNAVFDKPYPQFSVTDWAQQSSEIISRTIHKYRLSNRVVILAWSMAGAVSHNLQVQSSKRNFQILAFIGLAAVPGNPYIMTKKLVADMTMNDKGLITLKDMYLKWFEAGLAFQNKMNHHVIIPTDMYQKQYIGAPPINISASVKRYRMKNFGDDAQEAIADAGSFEYAYYPWIALISDDSQSDGKINIVDTYNWYQIIANMLYWKYLEPSADHLTPQQWEKARKLFARIPQNLTRTVHGSHFFFLGEIGAKATVCKMEELLAEIILYQTTIATWTRPHHLKGY